MVLDGERRALLIGAEEYGDDLTNLSAVQQDLVLMQAALESCGYVIDLAPHDLVAMPFDLGNRIKEFCQECGERDTRLIYFSGHGIEVKGTDFILPAGIDLGDARDDEHHRVSTDLSAAVQDSAAGLVIMIIDACRDAATGGWGKAGRSKPEPRFIRFFGCSQDDEFCRTLPDDPPVSVFTKALTDVLRDPTSTTLDDVLTDTERACQELAAAHHGLEPQSPRIDQGEVSSESRKLLQQAVFSNIGEARDVGWPYLADSFDRACFHCVVVTSEYESHSQPQRRLEDLVDEALSSSTEELIEDPGDEDPEVVEAGVGSKIWDAFRDSWSNHRLLDGARRELPDRFQDAHVRQVNLPVHKVFGSRAKFTMAVRAVIEADLAVFDVTEWEPGVMILIGIRSATRRGVSICSYGGKWEEKDPVPNLPFGLNDLSFNSHSVAALPGADPTLDRFIQRVDRGFKQLARQPQYRDLPAFDDLRQLGSRYESAGTIGRLKRVLVLCPYGDEYSRENWDRVRIGLSKALKNPVRRLIDLGSPQMISQSLFANVRRVQACVVDWTRFNATVFLELGVRLAVSRWGALQIIDERWMPSGEKVPRLRLPDEVDPPRLSQVEGLVRLLKPVPYSRKDRNKPLKEIAELLDSRNPDNEADPDYNWIYRLVRDNLSTVTARRNQVHLELAETADSLHHSEQKRAGVPQTLFHDNQEIKLDVERAALERRLAAWFYLEHRVKARDLDPEDPLRKAYFELGKLAKAGLVKTRKKEDFKLGLEIDKRLKE